MSATPGSDRSRRDWEVSRLTLLGVCLAALVILNLGVVPAADAYMQQIHICSNPTIRWEFRTVPAGSGAKQGWIRAAINTIDDELNYTGAKLVTVSESTPVNTRVDILNEPANVYGESQCILGPSMWVNSNYSAASFYYKVGRHEMLHLAGMSHGGRDDSRNGDNPATMSTCISASTFSASNILTQDDAGYMNWLYNSIADRQLHANVGYERGMTYWGVTNGSASFVTTGGATGPGHISFAATGTEWSSYVYQTIRLWTGVTNASYRSRINVRESAAANATSAMARLYRQTLQESGDNSCQYANGLSNPNNATLVGGYVLHSGTDMTAVVGTTWASITGAWANPADTDGLQLQIRAYGKGYTSTGGNSTIRFDNVRGEGT